MCVNVLYSKQHIFFLIRIPSQQGIRPLKLNQALKTEQIFNKCIMSIMKYDYNSRNVFRIDFLFYVYLFTPKCVYIRHMVAGAH